MMYVSKPIILPDKETFLADSIHADILAYQVSNTKQGTFDNLLSQSHIWIEVSLLAKTWSVDFPILRTTTITSQHKWEPFLLYSIIHCKIVETRFLIV